MVQDIKHKSYGEKNEENTLPNNNENLNSGESEAVYILRQKQQIMVKKIHQLYH